MRHEKKYLVEEVSKHLKKSDYVYLMSFNRLTVADVADIRKTLRGLGAEYHVVKNSILDVAARERGLANFDEVLTGHTAIVVGGDNPFEVAKVLVRYQKEKEEKVTVKLGFMGEKKLSIAEVKQLADLLPMPLLRAQFLALLNTPATQMARVLQAKVDAAGAAAA